MNAEQLRLALPFDVLADAGSVHLVAGEDFRVSLHDVEDPSALVELLRRLEAGATRDELYNPRCPAAILDPLLDQLIGERVIVRLDGDASPPDAAPLVGVVTGTGALAQALSACLDWPYTPNSVNSDGAARTIVASGSMNPSEQIQVFCQDTLDYAAALETNQRARGAGQRWLWASTGPRGRAFIGPVFLPNAGPCFGCILDGFRRLSEAPELYDALIQHSKSGGALRAAELDPRQLQLVADLVACKLAAYDSRQASAYRLHVLELNSLEVSSFGVWPAPECATCGDT